jgi:hypothetical protein
MCAYYFRERKLPVLIKKISPTDIDRFSCHHVTISCPVYSTVWLWMMQQHWSTVKYSCIFSEWTEENCRTARVLGPRPVFEPRTFRIPVRQITFGLTSVYEGLNSGLYARLNLYSAPIWADFITTLVCCLLELGRELNQSLAETGEFSQWMDFLSAYWIIFWSYFVKKILLLIYWHAL